jgi:endonuclease YncB( thermonuclease family)
VRSVAEGIVVYIYPEKQKTDTQLAEAVANAHSNGIPLWWQKRMSMHCKKVEVQFKNKRATIKYSCANCKYY